MNVRIALPIVVLLSASCIRSASEPLEVIMCPGDTIEYRASGGRSLKITATGTIERAYLVGDSLHFKVDLTPRPRRWYGARGLYRPRGVGNVHMTLEEAVQHFSSVEEANRWLDDRDRTDDGWMASIDDAGLFVTWRYAARPPGHQGGPDYALSVDVYQILVNLDKPKGLLKISDDVVSKNLRASCPAQGLEPSYAPSKPAELDGRRYSGRALDQMREQKFDSSAVERLIVNGTSGQNGTKSRQDGTETVFYNKPFVSPGAVRVDATGRVVNIS